MSLAIQAAFLAPFAAATLLTSSAFAPAAAKMPGHTYCFYSTCHRVKSLAETAALIGTEVTLQASFYDSCKRDPYNPCGLTSSGEAFHPERPDNAASPIYPDGTTLLVWSPETKQALVLRVNNAGPYWGNRNLDVSRATAELLGFKKRGVANLKARVISVPDKGETTYSRNRTYDPVPGYIGQYASAEDAHQGMTAVFAMNAIASSLLAPVTGGAVTAARNNLAGGDPILVAAAEVAPAANAEAQIARIALAFEQIEPKPRAKAPAAPRVAAAAVKPAGFSPFDVAEKLVRTAAFMIDDLNVPQAPKAASRTRTASASRVTRSRIAAAVERVKEKRVARLEKSARHKPARALTALADASAMPAHKAKTIEPADAPNDMSAFSRYAVKHLDPSKAPAATPQRVASKAKTRVAAKSAPAGSGKTKLVSAQGRKGPVKLSSL